MHHLEQQQSPKWSCIPIPKPSHSTPLHSPARAHLKPNLNHPKAQPSTSCIPKSNPIPFPSTPTVMADQLLGHLTSFNDHRPFRQTGTSSEFHTCPHISNGGDETHSARPTGTNENAISKHSTSSPDTAADKTKHDSQYNAIFCTQTALNPLMSEASSQLGITPLSPESITYTPGTPTSSPTSSTSSPSDSSSSPDSPTPSQAESDMSTDSTWSTRQLHPRLPITYNDRVLIKLHGRLQIHTLNNVLLPLPTEDTYSMKKESPTA